MGRPRPALQAWFRELTSLISAGSTTEKRADKDVRLVDAP